MEKITIFHYRLADAWGMPLCEISITQNESKASADYKTRSRKEGKTELDNNVIHKINTVMEMHPKIFEYTDLEVPDLFDGYMHSFDFTAPDGKSVRLLGVNIDAVRDPDTHFSPSLHDCYNGDDMKRNVIPIRAMEVVKTFDEITDILVENNIPQDCLLLSLD